MDKKSFQIGSLRNIAPNATPLSIPYDINKRRGDCGNLPGC